MMMKLRLLKLWKAASNRLDIIGDIVGHRNPDRIDKNLKDIHKAMKDLKEANALPLLLSSSSMIRVFPAFNCDKNNSDITDVLAKVKVVEESLGSFMKQSSDQMQKLANTLANINRPATVITPAPQDVTDTPGTLTPGSKKRKIGSNGNGEDYGNSSNKSVHGITPINNTPAPPVSFRAIVARNLGSIQQHQGTHLQPPQIHPPSRPQNNNRNDQYSRPRRNSTLVYGNAMSDSTGTENLELTADVSFVASSVSRDATPEQLGNFLVSKGLQVTEVELLTNFKRDEARSFTYRVAIKPEDFDKALSPDVWPHRVSVRLFRNKRRTEPLSWPQQVRQTGDIEASSRMNSQPFWKRPTVRQPQHVQQNVNSPISTQNRFVANGFEPEVVN